MPVPDRRRVTPRRRPASGLATPFRAGGSDLQRGTELAHAKTADELRAETDASAPLGAGGSAAAEASPGTPSAPAAWRSLSWGERWESIRFPVLAFVGIAVVLYAVVFLSNELLPRNPNYPIHDPLVFRGAGLLEGWVRYDGGWYRTIATVGYSYHPGAQSSVAFFPAYPLSMRALGWVVGDPLTAGILLTFTCGLGFSILFYRWCLRILTPPAAKLALLMVLLFPYAWYLYGAVYADALFLVCTMAAFVLLEKDRPVLAGLVAAVATAARPVGAGVVLGLLAVLLDRRGVLTIPYLDRVRQVGWRAARTRGASGTQARVLRVTPRALRPKDAGILLSGLGFAGWCTYLWIAWGSPTIFADIEGVPGWDQPQGPATWFKTVWFTHLSNLPEAITGRFLNADPLIYTLDITFQGLLSIGALCLIPLVIRRIGWSYAVYVFGVVALPLLGTKDWQGTGRYMLAAWPVFAALALWMVETDRRRLRTVILVVSGVALVFLTSGYARGYYLA
jgi:hypothetical protein